MNQNWSVVADDWVMNAVDAVNTMNAMNNWGMMNQWSMNKWCSMDGLDEWGRNDSLVNNWVGNDLSNWSGVDNVATIDKFHF